MNRRSAKSAHEITNIFAWLENPDWDAGSKVGNLACRIVRSLPFSPHDYLKSALFGPKIIAINGESVVADGDPGEVDKYMFRHPKGISLEIFKDRTTEEVRALTEHLAGLALPTQVKIKPAHVFKKPTSYVLAVTQTQRKLDLNVHTDLRPEDLLYEPRNENLGNTARDLESMLIGTEELIEKCDFYPDIGPNSGNLRRSIEDGSVTLIDVMPVYANGGRLIGDSPPNLLGLIQDNILSCQRFVGKFGG